MSLNGQMFEHKDYLSLIFSGAIWEKEIISVRERVRECAWVRGRDPNSVVNFFPFLVDGFVEACNNGKFMS